MSIANPYTFTMPAQAVELVAIFEEKAAEGEVGGDMEKDVEVDVEGSGMEEDSEEGSNDN